MSSGLLLLTPPLLPLRLSLPNYKNRRKKSFYNGTRDKEKKKTSQLFCADAIKTEKKEECLSSMIEKQFDWRTSLTTLYSLSQSKKNCLNLSESNERNVLKIVWQKIISREEEKVSREWKVSVYRKFFFFLYFFIFRKLLFCLSNKS